MVYGGKRAGPWLKINYDKKDFMLFFGEMNLFKTIDLQKKVVKFLSAARSLVCVVKKSRTLKNLRTSDQDC